MIITSKGDLLSNEKSYLPWLYFYYFFSSQATLIWNSKICGDCSFSEAEVNNRPDGAKKSWKLKSLNKKVYKYSHWKVYRRWRSNLCDITGTALCYITGTALCDITGTTLCDITGTTLWQCSYSSFAFTQKYPVT